MNIYEKLLEARCKLQGMNLKKTGENKFAKYFYYELQDFLPTINIICNEVKLIPVVTFSNEFATLTLIDALKPEDKIVFNSPLSSADMKGCQPVQNLGGLETYQRRYLYVMAFEIVEHDALDPIVGKNGKDEYITDKQQHTIADLLLATESNEKSFLEYMNIESVGKMPAKDYQKAVVALNKKVKK